MHGVSDTYVKRAFEVFGFSPYIPVKEQQRPDPEFPTVRFPNPEEKGALVNRRPYHYEVILTNSRTLPLLPLSEKVYPTY
jgi:hypothetical protein